MSLQYAPDNSSDFQNHVYDEHTHTLQIYWSTRDVISWLAENSDDEHLKKVKQNAEQHALKMEVASRSVHDEKALFDEDDADEDEIVLGRSSDAEKEKPETSQQRLLSIAKHKPEFEGLRAPSSGHKIQDIKELMSVPVRDSACCPLLYQPFFSGYRHR
jgi:protein SSD1